MPVMPRIAERKEGGRGELHFYLQLDSRFGAADEAII